MPTLSIADCAAFRSTDSSERRFARGRGVIENAIRCCSVFLCAVAVLLSSARAAVELPVGRLADPVAIRAHSAARFQEGAYDVWILHGEVHIRQGPVSATGDDAVLWIDRAESYSGRPSKIIAYLEGNVRADFGRGGDPHSVTRRRAQSLEDRAWLGRFHTTAGIELSVPAASSGSEFRPAILDRGLAARQSESSTQRSSILHGLFPEKTPAPASASRGYPAASAASASGYPPVVQPAQFTREEIAPPGGTPLPFNAGPAGAASRAQPWPTAPPPRVRLFARSGGRFNWSIIPDPDRNEAVAVISSGVQIVIDNVDQLGTVIVETDRAVAWGPNIRPGDPNPLGSLQADAGPLEFYLEGNIVFRQGDRVIYADRMYYNVRQEYGVVLNAEMLTPVPDYQGLLRLKAEVLQQVNRQHFEAYNAAITSSRIGVPRYWFAAENVSVDDAQTPLVDPFTNLPLLSPHGEPQVEHQLLATSRNNVIYLAGVPVFYWPVIATDLTEPTYYLTGFRLKNDSVLGTGVMLDWDLYQLLGIANKPAGTKFTLSTDYFNLRGPALGASYSFQGENLFGLPGPYRGFIDAWGIDDTGEDNLGRDWRALAVPDRFRGRLLARHRHDLPADSIFTAEVGLVSDYNFLEQYFEQEWDTLKDPSTALDFKRLFDNSSFEITGEVRPNGFVTDTEWLPRADHFLFGQALLFDRLTWHEHTTVGYARLRQASPPADPAQVAVISPLAWEADVEGLRAATRQELDLPLQAGPAKVVPYLLGEAAFWGEDLTGQSTERTYFQAGVKASLPMWRADPAIQSELFNLTGLAHKVTLEGEFLYADASENLLGLPLYDQLDDNATEFTRRQMAVRTFNQPVGTFVPARFDERLFAVRSNLQGTIAGPTEIADDLMEFRLGLNQRWQTKRGLAGQQRIIDWIVLDLGLVLFPDSERDNFGAGLGLVDYDFQWHLGDRLTLLSDGFFDGFDQGLRQATVGALISRPEHGSLYLGFRSTEGPITSQILAGSLSYRMSEKWIAIAGASWDFGQAGNIGQHLALTRIGESFLVRIGFNYDASRDNFGVNFGIEPRFLPSSRLGRVSGVQIPPAGALGLE